MKAIILVGKPNLGKSVALHLVINKMLASPMFTVLKAGRKMKEPFIMAEHGQNIPDGTIIFDFNGQIVLVTTYGDSTKYAVNAYQKACLLFGRVDLLICAAHKGKILNEILAHCEIKDFDNAFVHEKKDVEENLMTSTHSQIPICQIVHLADEIFECIKIPFNNHRFDIS